MKQVRRPKNSSASTIAIWQYLAFSVLDFSAEDALKVVVKNEGMGWCAATSSAGAFVGSTKLMRCWEVLDTPNGISFKEVDIYDVFPRMKPSE